MNRYQSIAAAISAFFLWSTLGVFFNVVKLPISVYVVFGSLVALLVLYLYFYLTRGKLPRFTFSPYVVGLFVVAGIKGVIWFQALAIYPIAKAMLIHNLAPVVAIILAPILIKEKPSFNHAIAIITGFLGLTILLRLDTSVPSLLEVGALLSIGTAVCSGLQDIFQRHLSPKVSGTAQAFIFILGQAVGSLFSLVNSLPSTISWVDFGSIFFFGIVGTAIPIVLLSKSFKGLKSFEVSTLGFTEPALGALWGALFLNQPVFPSTAIGGLLIFLSGLTAIKEEKSQHG